MHILFPRRCMCCGKVLNFENYKRGVCDSCKRNMVLVKEPRCTICGKPIRFIFDAYCKDCSRRKHSYIQGRGVFVYTGPMKLAMYGFKYSNSRYIASTCAQIAWREYKEWIGYIQPDVIIPVPMYEKKKRRRGYNQAEVFGRALSKESGIPVAKDYVIRCADTVPLKGLDLCQRQENLKNAFKIKENALKFNCALIVDDIYTTGTTIDAVAKVLQSQGVTNVYFLTICIGSDI